MKGKITKIVLLLALFATNAASYAQKCKYEIDEIDQLTSGIRRAISVEIDGGFTLTFNQSTDNYFIDLTTFGFKSETLELNDSVAFKLDNGEIIYFFADAEKIPAVSMHSIASMKYVYNVAYKATKEAFEKVKNNNVTYIRLNVGQNIYESTLKEKKSKKLKDAFTCLLK
jgi:hypothetical protein